VNTPVPTRITIEFGPDAGPGQRWVVGSGPTGSGRVEVRAVGGEAVPLGVSPERSPVTSTATERRPDCACPAFCELDHANE
jgi:hypothetical protein